MTTSAASYLSSLARAADDLAGAILTVRPSDFAESFLEARSMSRVAGEEGSSIPSRSPKVEAFLD